MLKFHKKIILLDYYDENLLKIMKLHSRNHHFCIVSHSEAKMHKTKNELTMEEIKGQKKLGINETSMNII